MSGLDKNSFDLFAPKKATSAPKPMVTKPATPKIIEEEITNFDEEMALEEAIEEKVVEIKSVPKTVVKTPFKAKTKTKFESKAKFDKFNPITIRMSDEEVMGLKQLENEIMRNRSRNTTEYKERITVNSIVRCLVSNFLENAESGNFSEIQNEEVLNERIKALFR